MGGFNSKPFGGWMGEGRSQHKNQEERDLNTAKVFNQLDETYNETRETMF